MSLSTRLRALVQAIGADIKSIFTTLSGLGTAATTDVMSSTSDTNAGVLMINGAHGLGRTALVNPYIDLDTPFNSTHFFAFTSKPTGVPEDWVNTDYPLGLNIHHNSSIGMQLVNARSKGLFWRIRHGSRTWSAMRQIWDSTNQLALGVTPFSARLALQLGTAATQNLQTVRSDVVNPVLRTGAGGLLVSGGGIVENVSTPTADYPSINGFFNSQSITDPNFGSSPAGIQFGTHYSGTHVTQLGGSLASSTDLRFRKKVSGTWGQVCTIHHSGSQLSLGTTPETARAAIQSSIMPAYTLATLPSAPANINMIAVVTDLPSGREPCISDGANWLKLSDKAVAA